VAYWKIWTRIWYGRLCHGGMTPLVWMFEEEDRLSEGELATIHSIRELVRELLRSPGACCHRIPSQRTCMPLCAKECSIFVFSRVFRVLLHHLTRDCWAGIVSLMSFGGLSWLAPSRISEMKRKGVRSYPAFDSNLMHNPHRHQVRDQRRAQRKKRQVLLSCYEVVRAMGDETLKEP